MPESDILNSPPPAARRACPCEKAACAVSMAEDMLLVKRDFHIMCCRQIPHRPDIIKPASTTVPLGTLWGRLCIYNSNPRLSIAFDSTHSRVTGLELTPFYQEIVISFTICISSHERYFRCKAQQHALKTERNADELQNTMFTKKITHESGNCFQGASCCE